MREEYGAVKYEITDTTEPRELSVVIPGFFDENDQR